MLVLQSFDLVLKKYGKWVLKMCGNPAYVSTKFCLTSRKIFISLYFFNHVITPQAALLAFPAPPPNRKVLFRHCGATKVG